MACLATIWGMRLTFNFHRRGGYRWPPWHGDEDYRWNVIRNGGFLPILQHSLVFNLFNFIFVSFYQNLLLLWIAAPSLVAHTMSTTLACEWNAELNERDALIAILFLLLLLLESVADNQQYAFQTEKHRQKNAGEVFTGEFADGFKQSGLFSIVRKPNYAAEQAIWLLFYSFSHSWNWSGFGVLQLVLLFQTSGWFTEKITPSKYPKYEDYMKRVPLYVPNPFYGKSKEA
jgi:steroid 5-alpha reductase family enzyme